LSRRSYGSSRTASRDATEELGALAIGKVQVGLSRIQPTRRRPRPLRSGSFAVR